MVLSMLAPVQDQIPLRTERLSPLPPNRNLKWRNPLFHLTDLSLRDKETVGRRCWRLPSIGGLNASLPKDEGNHDWVGHRIEHYNPSIRRLRPVNSRSSPPDIGWNFPIGLSWYTFVYFTYYISPHAGHPPYRILLSSPVTCTFVGNPEITPFFVIIIHAHNSHTICYPLLFWSTFGRLILLASGVRTYITPLITVAFLAYQIPVSFINIVSFIPRSYGYQYSTCTARNPQS